MTHIAPGFEAVSERLAAFTQADPSYSAQVCALRHGRTLIDLAMGPRLAVDSLIGVFSSSKGVAAMCTALLIESGDLDLDAPFARYWPAFAAADKAEVTVRTALSHRAGLPVIAGGFTSEDLEEHDELAARLAAARPLWVPGTSHGYHGITIGIIISELIRRITGATFRDFYKERLQTPFGIDFHFGVDDKVLPRVVDTLPQLPRNEEEVRILAAAGTEPFHLLNMVVNVDGFPPFAEQANNPVIRRSGPAAIGGVGNARSLAHLYSHCLQSADGPEPLAPKALGVMSQVHSSGTDLVLGIHNRFGIIFETSDARLDFGSPWAFGHDGGGGSIGFADPATGLAFGYTTGRMPIPGGADPRGLELARVIRNRIRSMR